MLSDSYAHKRVAQIDSRLSKLSAALAGLPEGRVHVSTSRKTKQLYQVIGKKGDNNYLKKYLKKSERSLAELLAKKELICLEINELNIEKKSLEAMIKLQEKAFSDFSYRKREKLSSLVRDCESTDVSWEKAPFTSSAPNQEARRVRAIDGTLVRSKSEAEIISLLNKYEIPYRYECDLINNGRIIGCPDFTIMHPSTYEIFIWEHFGLLDDIIYVRRNIHKIQSYIEAGYYPMINFLITSETAEKPFDVTFADTLIQQFLLQ